MEDLYPEAELHRAIKAAEVRLDFLESDNMLSLSMVKLGELFRPRFVDLYKQEVKALGAIRPERLSLKAIRTVTKSFHHQRVND